ncbi:BESS domain-containing protein, partial [Aphis craccivora]
MVPREQAYKAWENHRDTFRRKLKTDTETKSGQARSESVKWPFFNTMMFLKDVMIPRESSGNLPLTHVENELSPNNFSDATLDVYEENTSDTETDINCSFREPEASVSEFTSFAKPQNDQDYEFFMSLLPSVKQLNQIEKMRLRMKIMNDVTDALGAHQFVKK